MLSEFRDHLHKKQLWKGEGEVRMKIISHVFPTRACFWRTMQFWGECLSHQRLQVIVAQLSQKIISTLFWNQKLLQKILTGFNIFQFKAIKRKRYINSFEHRTSLTSNYETPQEVACVFNYLMSAERELEGEGRKGMGHPFFIPDNLITIILKKNNLLYIRLSLPAINSIKMQAFLPLIFTP